MTKCNSLHVAAAGVVFTTNANTSFGKVPVGSEGVFVTFNSLDLRISIAYAGNSY